MSLSGDSITGTSIEDEYVIIKSPSPTASVSDLEEFEDLERAIDREDRDELSDEPYYEKAVREIAQGDVYPCMICTVEMDFTCRMYACPECYRVFDYDCIREWAVKSAKKNASGSWKCPNCYFERREIPLKNRPTCWCGKNVYPDPNPLSPNSCGQTCDTAICVHGCSKACHLGPHPSCLRMVPTRCACGKESKSVFCAERPKRQSYRCSQRCGLTLPCGIHRCEQECHAGLCGECPETIEKMVKCYCGSESKASIPCKDIVIEGRSQDGNHNKWIGVFACKTMRTVMYSCNKHSFTEACKAPFTRDGQLQCPFAVEVLKTCPCGRNPLSDMNSARNKCTDPIPTCDSICGKRLRCGKHTCPFKCHNGDCMQECLCSDKVKCSCHAKTFLVPCKFEQDAKCTTKCESLMSCRRHRCSLRCCESREQARRREKSVFLARDKLDESLVEAQHICLKQCNLGLSCGEHFCTRKCHPGSCPPCLESSSEDLVCPCGKTVVSAPVRCGTSLPRCLNPCIKTLQGPLECGHPPMPHPCHPLSESCPSCTAPVFKRCKCGKSEKVRTLCFQNDVSCGRPCGEPLSSCNHTCQKTCHQVGDHQTRCNQTCGTPQPVCGHPCAFKCHSGSPCPDKPCSTRVTITCPCGRRATQVACGAHNGKQSASDQSLACSEICESSKRHAELMEAFGIQPVEGKGTNTLSNLESLAEKVGTFPELMLPFTEAALSIYAKQSNWCSQIEDCLNKLMEDSSRPSLHFKPMRPPQRHFIHELSQAYHLYCESQDLEPRRSCFVKKSNQSGKPPISLREALPLYHSFKQAQKERKQREFEKSTTTRIFNYSASRDPTPAPVAHFNGLLVKGVFPGVDIDIVRIKFQDILKHTLLKESKFTKLNSHDILVCTENYSQASLNVESDINRVVGHLSLFVKEQLLADSVSPCAVDQVLHGNDESEKPNVTINLETNLDSSDD
ncbi:LADA_0E11034g1_1 [Lachancea dasiensis]|uniref:LADA_0E11034g1_1 n=1 Tax=Lachancea dasiensis TaxID=1072105 RepID=A0A1G4JEJ7_9SACH|nr:LADA_0E11034g1_1 [Lachancea dasiensis]